MGVGDKQILAPTGEEYSHDDNIEVCPVCTSRDRDLIESLCAAGSSIKDLAVEFAFSEPKLRRHDSIHSTKPPNVDPMAILRHLRWLQGQADAITKRLFNGQQLSNNNGVGNNSFNARLKAIELSLKVADKMIDLTGAKKYMDPHVILPRWNQIMSQLADALKDNPSAIETLIAFMQQNAPEGTVAEVKAQRLQKYGREIPLDYGGKEGTDGTEYSRDKISNEELKKIWARNKPQSKKPKPTADEIEKKKKILAARLLLRQTRAAKRKAAAKIVSEKLKERWRIKKEAGDVMPNWTRANDALRKLRSNQAASEPTGETDKLLQPPSGV